MKSTTIDAMPTEKAPKKGPARAAPRTEAEAPEERVKGKKFGLKKVIILGVAGLIIIGGGVGVAAYMGFLPIPLPFLAEEPKPEKASPPAPFIGPILKIPPLVINLKDERGRHLVKARVVLEVSGAQWAEEVTARIPLLTDIIILTLSDKRLADLRPPGARENIKKDLVVLFNQSLKGDKIRQIYFDEFIFQ